MGATERNRRAGFPSGGKMPDYVGTDDIRIGEQLDALVSQLHGGLYEQASRGVLFGAASQGATTSTIALAATYTGLCLNNPVNSNKKLAVRQVGVGLSVAPAAVSVIGIGGGYAAGGVTVHTTPLVTYNMLIGSGDAAVGLADAACTLVGAPRVIMPYIGGMTAAALYPSTYLADLEGAIVLRPGSYVFIYTLTVVVGFFGITWEEMPL